LDPATPSRWVATTMEVTIRGQHVQATSLSTQPNTLVSPESRGGPYWIQATSLSTQPNTLVSPESRGGRYWMATRLAWFASHLHPKYGSIKRLVCKARMPKPRMNIHVFTLSMWGYTIVVIAYHRFQCSLQ
jgi:hypothetical protein